MIVKDEAEDGHILVVGGVGSGKSSGIAIPSLLAWRERVFCIDIKGELYKQTQRIRKNAKIFAPLDITCGYNPFYVLREAEETAHKQNKEANLSQEADAISMALIPLPPKVSDPFWVESARCMLTGMILYFYKLGFSFIKTMQTVLSIPVDKLILSIYNTTTIQTENEEVKPLPKELTSNEAVYYSNMFVGMADKTLSSIYAEMSRHIRVFATDINIVECLSQPRNNITPHDLELGNDIFISVPEHLLRQWKNLITLIVSQFLRHFEKRPDMHASRKTQPILFLLDEFPRIGKIDGITDALATLRSKRITICVIIQSLAQLDLIYGKEARQVIADTCQYKAILSAYDVDSQEYFSRLVGTHEVEKQSTNTQTGRANILPTGHGTTISMEEKRKVKPEDFATLGDIVLLRPRPYGYSKVEKIQWHENGGFMGESGVNRIDRDILRKK